MRVMFAILFITVSISTSFSAQKKPVGADFIKKEGMFSKMDQHALSTPSSAEKDVESLVRYLIKPALTDLDKARVIWRWITANIKYDVSYANSDWKKTYHDRKGVCIGYAGLFRQMAALAGLDVKVLTGWSKGYDLKPGAYTMGERHAWNAVNIDGKWYLLDATWGAGYVYEKKFHFRHNEFFFLTPPPQFVFTHLPDDPDWQILKEPIDIVAYNELPKVLPFFWDNNLKPLTHYSLVSYVRDSEIVKLQVPEDIEILPVLRFEEKPVKLQPKVSRSGTTLTIDLVFNHTGQFVLDIVGRKKGSKDWTYVMQYSFVSGVDKEPVITHDLGTHQRVDVYFPKVKHIRGNTDILFWYQIYDAVDMKVINGGKTYHIASIGGDDFKQQLWIVPGDVEVWVKVKDEDFFRPFATYIAK